MNTDDIAIRPTPNPDAVKFILNTNVRLEGFVSFTKKEDAKGNDLAEALFSIIGIEQVHFNTNIITIAKAESITWTSIETQITDTIIRHIDSHNPDFIVVDPEVERRNALPVDIQKIEGILDNTIRPYLHGDGGDLRCIKYENNQLTIQYQGACGTCPSAMTGTLYAIISVLKEEFNPDIEVYVDLG